MNCCAGYNGSAPRPTKVKRPPKLSVIPNPLRTVIGSSGINAKHTLTVEGGISGSTALWLGNQTSYVSASNGNIFTTGNISGSSTSTGSFGEVHVADKVGIGTTAPDYTLDVAGDAGFNEYIYHNGDADTFIKFDTDEINVEAGGQNMVYIKEGGGGDQEDKVTINNDAADVDFQVKGDNEANLFRTDALNDKVGIGTSTPSYKLDVFGHDAWTRASGVIVGNSGIVL